MIGESRAAAPTESQSHTPINNSPRVGVLEHRKDQTEQDLEEKRKQDERALNPLGPTYVGSGKDPDYEIPTGAQTETEVWKSLAQDDERQDQSLRQDRYGFLISVQDARNDADRSRSHREGGGAASSSAASADLAIRLACMPQLLRRRQQRGRLAQRYDGREKKWCKMLGLGGSGLNDYRRRRPEKLKRRVRKGIPDSLRIWAWLSLSGGLQLKNSNPGLFAALLSLHGVASPGQHGAESIAEDPVIPSVHVTDRDSKAESGAAAQRYCAPSAEVVMCIMRDLNRTLPNHLAFMRRQSVGQKALFSVLWASAAYRPLVGYVQGMGFLAAVLLLYMPDEDAFWTFQAMMQGPPDWPGCWAMERLFMTGMPGLQCCMYQVYRQMDMSTETDDPPLFEHLQFKHLLGDVAPRLAARMEREGVEPELYATHWFNTAFAYTLPFPYLLRVWDVFLAEGPKMLFRVGLAILQYAEGRLLEMRFETLLSSLSAKNLPNLLPPSPRDLIRRALGIPVSRRMRELAEEWQQQETASAAQRHSGRR